MQQVSCHFYDPIARFKHWDSKHLSVGKSLIGIGSTKDKSLMRALGLDVAAGDRKKSVSFANCIPTAVVEHAGLQHVMAVVYNDHSIDEQFFAFENSAKRDLFMQLLVVRALPNMLHLSYLLVLVCYCGHICAYIK